ncbi:MAG: type I 3-dehydroquinate dehydratase [Planctomycetota bacterium]|nr:type I 3-dehydroquinate dehydratase [Planctomycetota bacterium]
MICLSLMPETTEQALAGLAEAARTADLAELRLDAMREFDLPRLLASPPCPVIVTYRPQREGGHYDGPEGPRLETLRQAAELGARYIDVEHDALANLGNVPPAKVIVSYHNHERTPPDLADIYARLAATGAGVVKVAAMARHILDTVLVLRILRSARQPTIALSMGPRGVLTRILAPKFGALLTYAAPPSLAPRTGGGARAAPSAASPEKVSGTLSRRVPDTFSGEAVREAAPGQVSAIDMRQLYRADRIGPETRVYGVIADPVGHSLSPRIHNAAFALASLDAVYLPLWVEGDPAAFVRAMREFAFDGYSVTSPHKQAVMAALDEIEPLARRIGAVNTIQRRPDGSLFGTNTDWTAGAASIEAVVGKGWLKGKRALIVGAGGVGRAMAFALKERGASVTLTDVDEARAEALAKDVGTATMPIAALQRGGSGDPPRSRLAEAGRGGSEFTRLGGDLPREPWDILLNCTPIGMHPKTDATPVPREMLRPGMVVYDAVYNPLQTRLVREAREAGCRTVAGIDHFVRQAVEQFELWTGRPAPVDTMRQVVVEALTK